MKNLKVKLLFITFIVAIMILSVTVLAADENVIVVVDQTGSYNMVYIESYINKTFKFAFTNDEGVVPDGGDYIDSAKDSTDPNANNIAYVDNTLFTTLASASGKTYLWIEYKGVVQSPIEIDLENDIITTEDIQLVVDTTKRIDVDPDGRTQLDDEWIGEILYTVTIGNVKITSKNGAGDYYYKLVPLPKADYNEFFDLAVELRDIKAGTKSAAMFERLSKTKKFVELSNKLLPTSTSDWTEVEIGEEIPQPPESQTGDRFVLWLSKTNGRTTIIDVQFLTAERIPEPIYKDDPGSTSKLPITYDSIILIVVLAVVVIALVFVTIKMKQSKKGKHTN